MEFHTNHPFYLGGGGPIILNPSRRVPIIGPNGVKIINPLQPQDPLGPGGMQPIRPLGPGGIQPIGPLYNQGTLY